MQQRPQSSIVLLMIIMAVVMGLGGFLALSYLSNRPSAPEGMAAVMVDGVEVMVQLNAAKTVDIVGPGEMAVTLPEQTAVPQTGTLPQVEPPTEVPTLPPPTETPLPPTATPVPDKIIFESYTVQSGDSLYSIADRLDTSIALMAQYYISAQDLTPGNVIQLPIGNPLYCPGKRPYAVGEGDTAYSVAKRFNIDKEELQAINGLNDDYIIRVADILCVP